MTCWNTGKQQELHKSSWGKLRKSDCIWCVTKQSMLGKDWAADDHLWHVQGIEGMCRYERKRINEGYTNTCFTHKQITLRWNRSQTDSVKKQRTERLADESWSTPILKWAGLDWGAGTGLKAEVDGNPLLTLQQFCSLITKRLFCFKG